MERVLDWQIYNTCFHWMLFGEINKIIGQLESGCTGPLTGRLVLILRREQNLQCSVSLPHSYIDCQLLISAKWHSVERCARYGLEMDITLLHIILKNLHKKNCQARFSIFLFSTINKRYLLYTWFFFWEICMFVRLVNTMFTKRYSLTNIPDLCGKTGVVWTSVPQHNQGLWRSARQHTSGSPRLSTPRSASYTRSPGRCCSSRSTGLLRAPARWWRHIWQVV